MSAAAAFRIQDVRVERGGKAVLSIPSMALAAGEITAVVGPSGAGKSTLLRLLGGLQAPDAGTVSSRGRGGEPLAPGQVVMVFQRPALLRGTVLENAALGLRLQGGAASVAPAREWLKRLGLADKADRPVSTLSGGEFQRVALARALALRPQALLLDEPTSNLDPENVALIERLVSGLREEQGTTVVWVTHNPAQSRRIAQSVLLLMEGRLVEHAPVTSFFGTAARPETQDFLAGRTVW